MAGARRTWIVAAAVVFAAGLAPAAEDLKALADGAWSAGDHEQARVLYERILERDPDDALALTRSGLAHFWAGRHRDAEPRLRRALEVGDDRDARLALGRLLAWSGRYGEAHEVFAPLARATPPDRDALMADALALAWGRRYGEAVDGFDRLLARDPSDREARLGRARALAWGGRYREAEEEARRLLDESPGDADALALLANVHGWWGRYDSAEQEFRRLSGFPGRYGEAASGESKVARWAGRGLWAGHLADQGVDSFPGDPHLAAGAAYQLLAEGDLPAARRLAEGAADPEIAGELRVDVRRGRGPFAWAGFERWDDTDENEHDIGRAGAAWRPALPVEVRLEFEAIRAESDVQDGTGQPDGRDEATAQSAQAGVRLWPGARVRLDVHAGRVRYERFDGSEPSHAVGGVAVARRAGRLEVGGDWAREPMPWTAILIDNDLRWDRWRLFGRYAPAPRFEVGAEYSEADVEGGGGRDDENHREAAEMRALWHLRGERPRLVVGATVRTLDYDRDRDDGYFDPQDFRAALLEAGIGGALAGGRVRWSLRAEAGVQRFELGGEESGGDAVAGGDGALHLRAGRRGVVVLAAGYTDYAAQSATGFALRHVGVTYRWSR